MRPALLPFVLAALMSACGLAGVDTSAPATPVPSLLPLDEVLAAPDPAVSAETAEALAARGADLRARAAP